jgi:hypothetical protein
VDKVSFLDRPGFHTDYNTGMRLKNLRRAIGLVMISLSIALLVWSYWPAERQYIHSNIPAAMYRSVGSLTPAQADDWKMEFSYPRVVRRGEAIEMRVTLEQPPPAGPTQLEMENPSYQTNVNNSMTKEPGHSIVSFRLEIPGIQVEPVGEVSQRLDPGKKAWFLWKARVEGTGLYPGTIWIHLVSVPDASPANDGRRLLAAPSLEIRVIDLLGMGVFQTTVLGIVGLIAGMIFCLEWIVFTVNQMRR